MDTFSKQPSAILRDRAFQYVEAYDTTIKALSERSGIAYSRLRRYMTEGTDITLDDARVLIDTLRLDPDTLTFKFPEDVKLVRQSEQPF